MYTSAYGGIPLTDLVFYGKVYEKETHLPITDSLPGPITARIDLPAGIVASTVTLFGPANGLKKYYALRIKRFEQGTPRSPGDLFVMPGDRIHIYLNGIEVLETESVGVLATDSAQDIRNLDLNSSIIDTDGDGIRDDWEQLYFHGLSEGPASDDNKDGITNMMAYAMGLNPLENNSSRMPFLSYDNGTQLALYFRQSTQVTGLDYRIEGSDALGDNSWAPLQGIVVQMVGSEGASQILKAAIPIGTVPGRRFFRIAFYK